MRSIQDKNGFPEIIQRQNHTHHFYTPFILNQFCALFSQSTELNFHESFSKILILTKGVEIYYSVVVYVKTY